MPPDPALDLTLSLGAFASTQLQEEAGRQQATVEELAVFAILYYLADVDGGRISRELPDAVRGDGESFG